MTVTPIRASFEGAAGAELAARIDLPAGPVQSFALFLHCFTCSKDVVAARTIASALTRAGIGVLRFDFTGLGGSGGDFSSTNFSMNLEDVRRAAAFLAEHYTAPELLIGHSLGGAAAIAVASDIPSLKAVVAIAAPAHPGHVTVQFGEKLDVICAEGEAEVSLADRPFLIRRDFIDDLGRHDVAKRAAELKRALLVMHSPLDQTVGVENAAEIYEAAKHPKSFVSLDDADHLLTNKADGAYAADVIAAWSRRYLGLTSDTGTEADHEDAVHVMETAQGKFQNLVQTGPHRFVADEPPKVGGLGSGPTPYDLLSAALGACTTMTLRMYADRKKIPLDRASCAVTHEKTHGEDMDQAEGAPPKPDRFTRRLTLEGDLDDDAIARLYEIADRCPVHRTLKEGADVVTERNDT